MWAQLRAWITQRVITVAIEAKVRNMHRIDLNTEHFQCRRQVVGEEDKIDFRRERRVHRTKHSQEP